MTKVINGEFEKLESLKISDVLLTCNTSLEIFNEEFNRMSRMDDDLFTYEVEITKVTNIPYEDEVAKNFRIETNVFDFETPLCRAFKEFNYLLQIDADVLTNDIEGFKTYEDYKDDWIYEWNKDVPWVHEKPWMDDEAWKEPALVEHFCEPFNFKNGCLEWPTCSWRDDGYCNRGNLLGAYIVGNTLHYQDFKWYEALKDGKLKEEALKNKAIMEGIIEDEDNESSNEDKERCELFDDHEWPVCNTRRFEMIKYSFGQDEEYVAVKENKYDDLTSTSEDACRTYQEIFRMMDEGWMDLAGKEIDKVGELLIIWNPVCVVVMLVSRRIYNTHSCSLTQLGESTEQNIRGVSHSNSFNFLF
ncbi:hypothetical protein Tco_1042545 [Tanacetum coccineum]|uniref:Uncharacterized protein n=1 Tax=Tanacetum coccineum TaxID=301880 RepID=A0ABQ5GK12_9ASTR